MNITKLNTILLVGAVALLIWGLFLGPQRRLPGRFQALPSPDGPDTAMDTMTGRLCYAIKVPRPANDLPNCSDLR
jgi:hypothetical protein